MSDENPAILRIKPMTPEEWEAFRVRLAEELAKADPREQKVILLDPADEADPFDGEPYDPENDWHEESK